MSLHLIHAKKLMPLGLYYQVLLCSKLKPHFRDLCTQHIEPVNSISISTKSDVIVIEDITDDKTQQIRVDHSINCCGITLTSHDLNTLKPSKWLNDQVCVVYIIYSHYDTLDYQCVYEAIRCSVPGKSVVLVCFTDLPFI